MGNSHSWRTYQAVLKIEYEYCWIEEQKTYHKEYNRKKNFYFHIWYVFVRLVYFFIRKSQ